MNTKQRIYQLWRYLEVRDDETLIVRSYNQKEDKDEYIIAESAPDHLEIRITSEFPDLRALQPFQMIQQRDSSGRFVIPSIAELTQDRVNDY